MQLKITVLMIFHIEVRSMTKAGAVLIIIIIIPICTFIAIVNSSKKRMGTSKKMFSKLKGDIGIA